MVKRSNAMRELAEKKREREATRHDATEDLLRTVKNLKSFERKGQIVLVSIDGSLSAIPIPEDRIQAKAIGDVIKTRRAAISSDSIETMIEHQIIKPDQIANLIKEKRIFEIPEF